MFGTGTWRGGGGGGPGLGGAGLGGSGCRLGDGLSVLLISWLDLRGDLVDFVDFVDIFVNAIIPGCLAAAAVPAASAPAPADEDAAVTRISVSEAGYLYFSFLVRA